ncbi:MAG: phosphoribosyl-AMP cyclohydrolase [Eubacteriales bacterium]|nr:phosphoribosyl-AMP cyclohydrolase [Eubacteriales bacterium]
MEDRIFPCIYLKHGLDTRGFFADIDEENENAGVDPIARVSEICRNGAQGIMLFDFSEEEEEHEEALGMIRKITEATSLPVYGAGNIRTAADVEKLLEAGTAKCILNFSVDSNQEMLEEVSGKFGNNKIGVFVQDYNSYMLNRDRIETFASLILVDEDGDDDQMILEETQMNVLIHKGQDRLCEIRGKVDYAQLCPVKWKDFKTDANGLVPCIVQDHQNGDVLMLAYMNEESFLKTLETGIMTYWSRSRQEIWVKGLTSGHFQYVKSLALDCDNDTLLAKVEQIGAACHTGSRSCFFQMLMEK